MGACVGVEADQPLRLLPLQPDLNVWKLLESKVSSLRPQLLPPDQPDQSQLPPDVSPEQSRVLAVPATAQDTVSDPKRPPGLTNASGAQLGCQCCVSVLGHTYAPDGGLYVLSSDETSVACAAMTQEFSALAY